jgi:hypothetical protein
MLVKIENLSYCVILVSLLLIPIPQIQKFSSALCYQTCFGGDGVGEIQNIRLCLEQSTVSVHILFRVAMVDGAAAEIAVVVVTTEIAVVVAVTAALVVIGTVLPGLHISRRNFVGDGPFSDVRYIYSIYDVSEVNLTTSVSRLMFVKTLADYFII